MDKHKVRNHINTNHISWRSFKLYIHITLNNGNCSSWLGLQHVQLIDLIVVVDGHDVPLGQAGKVPQPHLQHGLGVGQVKEIFGKRLELAEGGNWKCGRLNLRR